MLGESVLNTFQTQDNHDVQVNHHYWSCDRPISGLVTSLFFVWGSDRVSFDGNVPKQRKN